jgi:hypothetical protein
MSNKLPIHLIQHKISVTAPAGVKVAWEYPGYISILLTNGTEIAFGDSLEKESGYSWNNFNVEGNNTHADSFDDLGDVDLIVNELWKQIGTLMNEEAK